MKKAEELYQKSLAYHEEMNKPKENSITEEEYKILIDALEKLALKGKTEALVEPPKGSKHFQDTYQVRLLKDGFKIDWTIMSGVNVSWAPITPAR